MHFFFQKREMSSDTKKKEKRLLFLKVQYVQPRKNAICYNITQVTFAIFSLPVPLINHISIRKSDKCVCYWDIHVYKPGYPQHRKSKSLWFAVKTLIQAIEMDLFPYDFQVYGFNLLDEIHVLNSSFQNLVARKQSSDETVLEQQKDKATFTWSQLETHIYPHTLFQSLEEAMEHVYVSKLSPNYAYQDAAYMLDSYILFSFYEKSNEKSNDKLKIKNVFFYYEEETVCVIGVPCKFAATGFVKV